MRLICRKFNCWQVYLSGLNCRITRKIIHKENVVLTIERTCIYNSSTSLLSHGAIEGSEYVELSMSTADEVTSSSLLICETF